VSPSSNKKKEQKKKNKSSNTIRAPLGDNTYAHFVHATGGFLAKTLTLSRSELMGLIASR
jgi:hypothetical protein